MKRITNKGIVLFLVLLFTQKVFAQTVNGPLTLSSPNTTGNYSSNTSVTLSTGFTSLAPFSATIKAIPYTPAPSQNMNYIQTFTPRVPITAAASLPSGTIGNVNQSIQYADGLGRPIQMVQVQASPTQRDLVQPMAYDQFDREAVKYLPYSVLPISPSDGSYKTTAITDQASFYANPASTWNAPGVTTTPFPTAGTFFEASPLNRVLEQGAAGDNWQLTGTPGATNPGHTEKIVYTSNSAASLTSGTGYWAKNYGVTFLYTNQGVYLYRTSLADHGSYAVDALYVTVTKNENWSSAQSNLKWNTTEEYKDVFGRLLVKRAYNYNTATSLTETLSTYYVYDVSNNLVYVLPPLANPDAGGISQSTLDNLCYQYRYDGRNRLIGKKIPGKGWELTLYNKLDQPVATQDSVQRTASPQQWTVIKYDAMGREILTGIYQYSGSTPGTDYSVTLQSLVNAQSSQWESTSTTGNGYTTNTWPTTWATTLTLNYYDNYNAVPGGLPYSYTTGSNMTRGQLTAVKTAVLNAPTNVLWAQHYYDDYNRVIKSYQQHYLGGVVSVNNYDAITNSYNFANQVTTTTRQHYNTANTTTPLVTIANTYLYDQVGRKNKTWEQITNGVTPTTKTLISQVVYNEVGQITTKQLHSTDSVNFLQNIAYAYNERGWLLNSSAPLFEEQLQYNIVNGISGITPTAQYNGNIASQSWGTSAAPNTNSFSYLYDNLDRLTSGNSLTSYNENNIAYDVMGNITSLNRYQAGTLIDQLAYTYTSSGNATNQLQSIADASGNNSGLVNGTTSYSYDGNGNMLSSANTVNTSQNKSFTYNMLNLPIVSTIATGTATYTYDATGNKLRKVDVLSGVTKTTDYISGIEYDNSTTAIGFIQTEEGKAVPTTTGGYDYTYYLGDNLGNTRITFDTQTGAAVIEQQDDYYPFGLEINRSVLSPKNEYLYNKKELQEEFQEYDYGARFYDPVIGRWNVVDAYAEHPLQIDLSPYAYVGNNPIDHTDPDGNCSPCLLQGWEEGGAVAIYEAFFGSAAIVGTVAIISHAHHSGSNPVMQQDATRVAPQPAIVQARPGAAPGSRPGKVFTPKEKQKVINENKAKNDGKTVCEHCGIETTKPEKSQKGVTPPKSDTNVDHIDPKSNGGSGTAENGQVLCGGCNTVKRDNIPTPPPPPPPPHQ